MRKRTCMIGIRRADMRPRSEAEIAAMLAGPLQALAVALAAAITAAVANMPGDENEPSGDEWIRHDRSPLGARRTRELAKRGAFRGARKVGRKWLILRSELDAFIQREGTTSPANDNADEGADPAVQSLAKDMGYDLTPSDSEQRRKR